jgi:hypothetical protein
MNMSVGLAVPTEGTATVLGGHAAGSRAALDGIAFVAQDAPVYRNLSAGRAEAQAHLLIRTGVTAGPVPPGWETHPVGLEELVLAYLRAPAARWPCSC